MRKSLKFGSIAGALVLSVFVLIGTGTIAWQSQPTGLNEKLAMKGSFCVTLTDTATGEEKQKECVDNLIVDVGRELWGNRLFDASTGVTANGALKIVALGRGTTGAADGDTLLEDELEGPTYVRKTVTTPTYDDPTNVVTIAATWNEAFTCACTETGTFDATTIDAGDMLSRQTFSVVNKASGDTLTVTWTYDLG